MPKIAIGLLELGTDTRTEGALGAADTLTLEVVRATAALPPDTPPALGRSLREAAVLAQAGLVAACREDEPRGALHALWAADHGLTRLGVWIDLARRFGDLGPHTANRLLTARERVHRAVEALATDRGEADLHPRGGMTLDVHHVVRHGAA